jgi:NAD(P)-dependent dehydrogenase (short-subunit alcohol dehydrogenase family)
MSLDFAGKVALVTGAGNGLGSVMARQFAQRGAAVVLADIDEQAGKAVADSINQHGGRALFVRADVTRDQDVAAMVERTVREFGGLDCAVNNAAVEGEVLPLIEQSPETYRRVMAANVDGVFFGLRHEIPALITRGGGTIVNVSSIAGLRGHPGIAPYVASKHAVNGLTKTAAIEYGPRGIRVNSLCPGGIWTPQLDRYLSAAPELRAAIIDANPLRRLADAEEMARAALWLCSADASYVNGHELVVDGGKIVSDV